MSKEKKILRKNEFRMDNNPLHFGEHKQPHPAYISAKRGHKYKANSITHARYVDDIETLYVGENPNKQSKDKRKSRISRPFWQSEKQFSKEKLPYYRFSKQAKKRIRKYNKKFE